MNRRWDKVKLGKTLREWINPRLKRIIMFNKEGTANIYLLNPKKEVNRRKKKDTFVLDGKSYVYDKNQMFMINKRPYLMYFEGCSLPFNIKSGDNAPIVEYSNPKKLHTVLDMHFLESVLSTTSDKVYTIFIIAALIGGILIGHFLG